MKKVTIYAPRFIIGNDYRHFVLKDEKVPDRWVLPGNIIDGIEYINKKPVLILKNRIATTDQLIKFAKLLKMTHRIDCQYPSVYRD